MKNGSDLPKAFKEEQRKEKNLDDSPISNRVMSFVYALMAFVVMAAIGKIMNLRELCVTKNILRKNEFRFLCVSASVVAVCCVYLYFVTRNIPAVNRATRMREDHPVPAYTMTFSALIMIISSLCVSLYLMEPMGIVFWGAFWVAFYNIMIII